MRRSRHRLAGLMAGAALVVATTIPVAGAGATPAAVTGSDWPAYLYNTSHSSTNAGATAIDAADASSLTPAWTFKPTTMPKPGLGGISASPTVVGGIVYIGANNGTFYASTNGPVR